MSRAILSCCASGLLALTCLWAMPAAPATPAPPASTPTPAPPAQKVFATPEAAFQALVDAAEKYDLPTLAAILGPDGADLVATTDQVQDKHQAAAFAAKAREKMQIVRDPKDPKVAFLSVGNDDWPMPIPVVQKTTQWHFDTKRGKQEVLLRRIGGNELDAIQVCRGYVEAQTEYAEEKHDGSPVNQYAQKIISTPGKQDGLAWQGKDGDWEGPVGEAVAKAIDEGYGTKLAPYHGYYYRVLKGQGPSAPLGRIDFVVEGVMIGGFALVAAPADYGVTGIMTFIVSHDGVVYEKDLGEKSLETFRAMDLYDPDATWHPVKD